jgi:hypothetical protein
MRSRCGRDALREEDRRGLQRVRKGQLMRPGINRTAVRKTMRVATVFTGAAACATAFVAPAAAGTGQHAVARPGQQPRLNSSRVRPLTNIESRNCADVGPSWVHFGTAGAGSICWGYSGRWTGNKDFDYFTASRICGGNNSGSYGGYSDYGNGDYHTAGFGHGTGWVHLPWPDSTVITMVYIKKYKGSDKCLY